MSIKATLCRKELYYVSNALCNLVNCSLHNIIRVNESRVRQQHVNSVFTVLSFMYHSIQRAMFKNLVNVAHQQNQCKSHISNSLPERTDTNC